MKILTSLFAVLLIPVLFVYAQDESATVTYTVDNAQSSMVINGGSTVGSWDADVTQIDASFTVDLSKLQSAGESVSGVFNLSSFSIPVEKIVSDGNRMTRNIHKYLKERDYPQITFSLESAEIASNPDSDGQRFDIITTGVINAAGAANQVTMTLIGELLENGSILLSGTQPVNFSDFDIDRPSAMLGTVRASEEMEIVYSLVLVRK